MAKRKIVAFQSIIRNKTYYGVEVFEVPKSRTTSFWLIHGSTKLEAIDNFKKAKALGKLRPYSQGGSVALVNASQVIVIDTFDDEAHSFKQSDLWE